MPPTVVAGLDRVIQRLLKNFVRGSSPHMTISVLELMLRAATRGIDSTSDFSRSDWAMRPFAALSRFEAAMPASPKAGSR